MTYRGPESSRLVEGISSMDLDAWSRHLSSVLILILVNTVKLTGSIFIGWRIFARDHLQSKYGFADPTELHLAIKASCDAGEMIDSGYILWYIKPELQGESNQNVDEPSDRPESPTGRCDNV